MWQFSRYLPHSLPYSPYLMTKRMRALIPIFVVLSVLVVASGAADCLLGVCTRDGSEEMQLPSCYKASTFYRTPLSGVSRITQSKGGAIYVQHSNDLDEIRVSLLDVVNRTLTTVVDFDDGNVNSFIFGGPGQSFFVKIDDEIHQYSPDATYTVWGQS
jgi:hypothetical protein